MHSLFLLGALSIASGCGSKIESSVPDSGVVSSSGGTATNSGGARDSGIDASTPSQAQTATEEVSVYAAILASRYPASFYVFHDKTSVDVIDRAVEDLTSSLRVTLENASAETLASWRTRNDSAYALPSNMSLGAPYVVLTEAELLRTLQPDPNAWASFYQAYPGAKGIIQFSRVGLNSKLDQAIVYVGDMYASLGGEGYYYLMQKSGATWVVVDEVMLWIS